MKTVAKIVAFLALIAAVGAITFSMDVAFAADPAVTRLDTRMRVVETTVAAHEAEASANLSHMVQAIQNIERVSNENAQRLNYIAGVGGSVAFIAIVLQVLAFFEIKPAFKKRGG